MSWKTGGDIRDNSLIPSFGIASYGGSRLAARVAHERGDATQSQIPQRCVRLDHMYPYSTVELCLAE